MDRRQVLYYPVADIHIGQRGGWTGNDMLRIALNRYALDTLNPAGHQSTDQDYHTRGLKPGEPIHER